MLACLLTLFVVLLFFKLCTCCVFCSCDIINIHTYVRQSIYSYYCYNSIRTIASCIRSNYSPQFLCLHLSTKKKQSGCEPEGHTV